MDTRTRDTVIDDEASAGGYAGTTAAPRITVPYPHHLAADHRLPDGMALRTRPIAPSDRRRHWRFLCSLSLQTRYQRLMSARPLSKRSSS